jgi:hypothetical protein
MPNARVLLIGTLVATWLAVSATTAQSLCNPCVDPPLERPPQLFERRPPIGPDFAVHSRTTCGIAIPWTHGGSEWRVSECVDGVVVVAQGPGRIAWPFFTFSRRNGGAYDLDDRTTTPGTREHAAYVELRALSSLDVAALVGTVRVNACRGGQTRSCSRPATVLKLDGHTVASPRGVTRAAIPRRRTGARRRCRRDRGRRAARGSAAAPVPCDTEYRAARAAPQIPPGPCN